MKSGAIIGACLICGITLFHRNLKGNILKVPEDYQYVQLAINVALSSDTILINTGTYTTYFEVSDKSLTIASYYLVTNDPVFIEETILDASYMDRVIYLHLNGAADSVSIVGLSVCNGFSDKGAGIFKIGNGTLIVEDCHIFDNHAETSSIILEGGGIYNENGTLVISGCEISNNKIISGLNNASGSGAGVFCYGDFLISKSKIHHNMIVLHANDPNSNVDGSGGGLWVSGNGLVDRSLIDSNLVIVCADTTSTGIVNSLVAFADGGGILMNGNCMLQNSVVSNNQISSTANSGYLAGMGTAISEGGGINGFGTIINCLVISNSAHAEVGGIANACEARGGGVFGNSIQNSSIANNSIEADYELIGSGVAASLGVKNSIVFNNTGSNSHLTCNGQVSYCNVEGGFPGTGNINIDPGFAGSGDTPWELAGSSPCIDAGSEETTGLLPTDLAGKQRILDGNLDGEAVVDMGAYEYFTAQVNAEFYADLNYGKIPLVVQFTDNSSTINTAAGFWSWDFDNDGFYDSFGQNPQWSFTIAGTYNIKLLVSDTSKLFSDSITKMSNITAMNMEAGFYANVLFGQVPLTLQFYDTTEYQFTEPAFFAWDFNLDGITDSMDPNPVWTYDETGLYSVQQIVADTSGILIDTLMKQSYIIVADANAAFSADSLVGEAPFNVHFFDNSSAINTLISNWYWDFETDGNIDSWEQNPQWQYNGAGIYSISLYIADTSGLVIDSVMLENYIEVFPPIGITGAIASNFPISVFPNPCIDYLNIEIHGDIPSGIECTIWSLDRQREVLKSNYSMRSGHQTVQLNSSMLKAGAYIGMISTPRATGYFKFVKIP
ncbi:MAG: hypothetical protein KDC05_15560 [Bacteroidales bacterium]|nr:hypothetical protein [Bacteroidales bacterium]